MDYSSTPTRRVALGHLDSNRPLVSPVNNFRSPLKKVVNSSVLSPVRQQLEVSRKIRTPPVLERKLDYVFPEVDENDKRQMFINQSAMIEEQEDMRYNTTDDDDDHKSSQKPQDRSFSQSATYNCRVNASQNTTISNVDQDLPAHTLEGYIPQNTQFISHTSVYTSPRQSSENVMKTVEELRVRLRFLMYKVRTNQMHTPLENLAIISLAPNSSKPLAAPLHSPTHRRTSSKDLQNIRLPYTPESHGSHAQLND